MANLFFTGFEGITTAQVPRRFPGSSATGAFIGTSHGRFGNGVRAFSSTRPAVRGTIPATTGPIFVGFAVRFTGTASTRFLDIRGASNPHVIGWWNASLSRIEIRGPDDTSVLVASDTNSVVSGVFVYFELSCTVSDASGALELRLNNASVDTASGVDTKGADATITTVDLIESGSFGSTVVVMDDWYVNDSTGSAPHNTFYGDVKVLRVNTAANSSVQFTPNASTNQSRIADTDPDDDTTYNESTTATHRDLFTVSGFAEPTGAILGVAVRTVARKTDAGGRTFNAVAQSGATVVTGTPTEMATSYTEHNHTMVVDPNTSAAFANAAAVNGLLIGYEIAT